MEYGINLNSAVALRAEPDHRSEMISQLLLGEQFICNDHRDGFSLISNRKDNYSGWVDNKTIISITEEEYNNLANQSSYYIFVPLAEGFDLGNKCVIRLPGGSRLPNCDGLGLFSLHGRKFQVHRDFILPESEITKDDLLLTATSFINAPYLWGGKTVMGIDCSGFTQVVFGLHGYNLPRDSKDQAQLGGQIGLENARPGDLAFFNNPEGKIIHVGILLEKDQIIHASGRVKIDKLDNNGIYSNEYQRYTHTLHSVRRIHN